MNKEGKKPVMLRIYLNNERLSIGSTGISVLKSLWDIDKERLKGRTTEVLRTNWQLDNISNELLNIFHRLDFSDGLCLEQTKEEFLGKKGKQITTDLKCTMPPRSEWRIPPRTVFPFFDI